MFYFEIKSLCKKHSDIEDIFNYFKKINYKEIFDSKIGISFPNQTNGLLNTIRFFCSDEDILILLYQKIYDYAQKQGVFKIYQILEVPQNAIKFIIEKDRQDNKYRYTQLNSSRPDLFYIKRKSNSNGQIYSLYYKYLRILPKEVKIESELNYNPYGFSKKGEKNYVFEF